MHRNPFLRPLFVAFLFLLALPGAAADIGADARLERTLQLLDRLDAGRWNDAGEHFDATLRGALDAGSLEQVWTTLPTQVGAPTGRGEPHHERVGAFDVVVVPLRYQAMTLDARVSFAADGSIAGFHVVPAAPPPPPAAAPGDPFVESDFQVGQGDGALAGTLALPGSGAGDRPLPAVVLVHGSGPHDRNETIGPNRPFLDLARGLAAHGIAALRYEKRSKARPQDFAGEGWTVDLETVDDAVAAVAALRADPRVDAARVYVVGHSLGAMMAPRIGARSDAAGLVLLAAPARPLEDIVLDQVRGLAAMDGTVDPDEQARIDALAAGAQRVKALGAGHDTADGPLLLDLPASYWRDLRDYDPVAALAALSMPALVVHGGRDIQVTAPDFDRWRQEFSASRRVQLREFPALNHLLIAGTGPGTTTEYFQPGHVDAALIETIADWIGAAR